jgi:flagellar protein FlgJ
MLDGSPAGQLTELRTRLSASGAEPRSLSAAAKEFESLFVQMMLKQMRETGFGGGLFDSSRMDLANQMFDREIAREIGRGEGLGLADLLVRQLQPQAATSNPVRDRTDAGPRAGDAAGTEAPPDAAEAQAAARGPAFAGRDDFLQTLRPLASDAARRLDVPAEAITAQAALETGWGRHVMRAPNGEPAWNLFGIKAGSDWEGAVVSASTLEVREGVAVREVARFRAYDSPADAMDDYVRLLSERSRYADVLGTGGDASAFAAALQAAGYATDPEYAAKIERIAGQLRAEASHAGSQGNRLAADDRGEPGIHDLTAAEYPPAGAKGLNRG